MKGGSVLDRLMAKVEKQPDGCWLWRGADDGKGRPQIRVDGRTRRAHRVAYELLVGPIPEGHTLDHECRQIACVNPGHLEPVTIGENIRRGAAARGYAEFCGQGHRRDYVRPDGRGLDCSTCRREAGRRYREKAA